MPRLLLEFSGMFYLACTLCTVPRLDHLVVRFVVFAFVKLCITFVYLLRPLFLTCSVAVSVCISGYMPFTVASSQIYIAYPLEFLLHYNLFWPVVGTLLPSCCFHCIYIFTSLQSHFHTAMLCLHLLAFTPDVVDFPWAYWLHVVLSSHHVWSFMAAVMTIWDSLLTCFMKCWVFVRQFAFIWFCHGLISSSCNSFELFRFAVHLSKYVSVMSNDIELFTVC